MAEVADLRQAATEPEHRKRSTALGRVGVEDGICRSVVRFGIDTRHDDTTERCRLVLVGEELIDDHVVPCKGGLACGDQLCPVGHVDLALCRCLFGDLIAVIDDVRDVPTVHGKLRRDPLVPDSRHYDHEGGHRHDDDGVDEGLYEPHHALGHRFVRFRRRVCDRRRSLTCFVGKEAPVHSPVHRHEDGADARAGHPGGWVERLSEDQCEAGKQLIIVQQNDRHGADYVDGCHDRRQEPRDLSDSGNATDDYRCDDRGRHQAGDQVRDSETRSQRVGESVGLNRIPCEEGGGAQHDGEENRQRSPLGAQSPLDVIHGAARHCALPLGTTLRFLHVAITLGQGDLGELRRHPQQCSHPHPEERARPAPMDGPCSACDVADSHGGRQRGGEGLEVRNVSRIAGIVVPPTRHGETVAQVP